MNGRWKSQATTRATPAETASVPRSTGVTARTSPNRIAVTSVANDRDPETMITPSASIPTKSSPIAVSYDNPPRRRSACTPNTMTPALTAAPRTAGTPVSVATATPGSMPCASDSPRKAIPRTSTQVPTTAHSTAAVAPAASARSMKSTEKGSVSQVTVPNAT